MFTNSLRRARCTWLVLAVALLTATLEPLSVAASENHVEDALVGISLEDRTGSLLQLAALDELATRQATSPASTQSGYGPSIAGFALGYVGYPYVYAGNGPGGFDCSGFTQYVILNVLGVDIGHWLDGQPGTGAWIEYGAWQPGDLIFFQNTYRPGISHVAIYIGDGQIVHAENEETGVTIDSLYSSYYAPRYWGAVRVG